VSAQHLYLLAASKTKSKKVTTTTTRLSQELHERGSLAHVRTHVCVCIYIIFLFLQPWPWRKVQRYANNDIIKLVPRVFRETPPQSRRSRQRSKKLTHIRAVKVKAGNDLNYLAELSPLITKRTRCSPVALLSDRETSAFFAPRECCKFSLLDNFNIASGKYKLCCNYL